MTESKFNSNAKKIEAEKSAKQPKNEFKIHITYSKSEKDYQCSKSISLQKILIIIAVLLTIGTIVWGIFILLINSNTFEERETKKELFNPDEPLLVSRMHWLAQPPSGSMSKLQTPISLVIIHHTATSTCSVQAECIFITRSIQEFHIESRGWSDIGYNFLIGGDGQAYEGRGWGFWGAHTAGFNNISIGVGFIGTFSNDSPPEKSIFALRNLLKKGVDLGYLKSDYKIMAARQFSKTESPGQAFFYVIKTWNNWSGSY